MLKYSKCMSAKEKVAYYRQQEVNYRNLGMFAFAVEYQTLANIMEFRNCDDVDVLDCEFSSISRILPFLGTHRSYTP